MRLLKTVRQKFLSVKRKIKHQYFLTGGPFNEQSLWLSPVCKTTLPFTVKGVTGRYIHDGKHKGLKWESHD